MEDLFYTLRLTPFGTLAIVWMKDGELGGFQGGLKMKRTLLELEGIRFSLSGKVLTPNLFY